MTMILGITFALYFGWSILKIVSLQRLLRYRDAAYLRAVTDYDRLLGRFRELNEEVAVKHREITESSDSLLRKIATLLAAQNSNQHVN